MPQNSSSHPIQPIAGMSDELQAKLMEFFQNNMVPASTADDPSTRDKTSHGVTNWRGVLGNVTTLASQNKKDRAQERLDEMIGLTTGLYDLVYAKENDVLLMRNKYAKYAHAPLAENEGVRLLTAIYSRRHPDTTLPDRAAHDIYRTLRNKVATEVKCIDDKLVLVGYNSDKEGIIINTLYWDANDGQFVRDIKGRRCFRRLFDNGDTTTDEDQESEWRYRLRLEDIDQDLVTRVYQAALAILDYHKGNLVPYSKMTEEEQEYFIGNPAVPADLLALLDYTDPDSPLNTFWVWSNRNLGRTNDLLKASASMFLKKKPTGAFLLVGKTRNGKSTFIDMLKAELGLYNTSGVKLTDFDDTTHFADDLATTMLNAPDDDEDGKEDKILKSQGTFKTITAHGMVAVRRLYSSNSIKLHARWMNIFPMNDIPQWQGSSKEACMKRSLCISFNNDLSRSDKASKDFASETFTAHFYSVLLGVQGAIASYYASHDLHFSEEMEMMRNDIKEDIDGEDVFVDKLTRYFKGMNATCAESEYQIWSRARHISFNTKDMKKRLKMSLGWESSKDKKKSTYYNYVSGTSCSYDKFGEAVQNDSDLVMADKQMILIKVPLQGGVTYEDKLVQIEELHTKREVGPEESRKDEQSVIQEIENYILNTPGVETIRDYCDLLKQRCQDEIWT